ncbi:GTP cyclohydrolase FolE2 [Sutcliffiella halmapala]|uniref:GTP cyclohydrolase FolE2 n=1 Tax=Sutcliffiella halmapala TaxID=79882 RepID=UPI000994E2D2|nr:GTP cyclohydrolase FolE2 [Sutcliffiella halmapala]
MNNIILPSKEERLRYFGSVPSIEGDKPKNKEQMNDLQNTKKDYFFAISHVGIKNITYPVKISSTLKPYQQDSIGIFTLTTGLERNQKGINMSRLPEILQEYYTHGLKMDFSTLRDLSKRFSEKMEQSSSSIHVTFPWFFERKSPQVKLTGLMKADVDLLINYEKNVGWTEKLIMTASVTTLCPCSKEISEYSAHNQRGIVKVEIENEINESFTEDTKETILNIIESNASAMLHPILKRPDEKRVTEQAYENPRFVEDLIRLIAADLYLLDWVDSFKIECRNEESIHLHDAYAKLEYRK